MVDRAHQAPHASVSDRGVTRLPLGGSVLLQAHHRLLATNQAALPTNLAWLPHSKLGFFTKLTKVPLQRIGNALEAPTGPVLQIGNQV